MYYQNWLHPWRHIIASEPRFKSLDSSSYSTKFIAGSLVATVFAVGDLFLLGAISLKSYPSDVWHGVVYLTFPYAVAAISMFFFFAFLAFSPVKLSENIKLKAIGRPNFILACLINIYKISGIQGSILVGILKFYQNDLNDGMLDLYIGLYITCVLLGVLTTVWLYMDSSLKQKLGKGPGQLHSAGEIWREAKDDVLWVGQRDFSLIRTRPLRMATPPLTPPDLPERKPSSESGVRKLKKPSKDDQTAEKIANKGKKVPGEDSSTTARVKNLAPPRIPLPAPPRGPGHIPSQGHVPPNFPAQLKGLAPPKIAAPPKGREPPNYGPAPPRGHPPRKNR